MCFLKAPLNYRRLPEAKVKPELESWQFGGAQAGLRGADLSLRLGRGHLRQEDGLPEGSGRELLVSRQVKCCGWVSFYNWTDNAELMNRTNVTYPCSCEDRSEADDGFLLRKGFCEAFDSNRTESGNSPEYWPVYREVCGKLWGPGRGWAWGARGFWYSGCSGLPGLLLPIPFLPSVRPSFLPFFHPSIFLSFFPSHKHLMSIYYVSGTKLVLGIQK